MIAAVTDLANRITGAHRTWLAPDGSSKAPVDTSRLSCDLRLLTRKRGIIGIAVWPAAVESGGIGLV